MTDKHKEENVGKGDEKAYVPRGIEGKEKNKTSK